MRKERERDDISERKLREFCPKGAFFRLEKGMRRERETGCGMSGKRQDRG